MSVPVAGLMCIDEDPYRKANADRDDTRLFPLDQWRIDSHIHVNHTGITSGVLMDSLTKSLS